MNSKELFNFMLKKAKGVGNNNKNREEVSYIFSNNSTIIILI